MTTFLVQIGQGWPEEPINTLSAPGWEDFFKRLKDTLAPFEAKFEVAVLHNPTHANWNKTVYYLDLLVKYLPYVIDFATSDNLALGWVPQNRPYDAGHAVGLPVQLARAIADRHAQRMLGARVHELFSIDYEAQCFRDGSLNWLVNAQYMIPPGRILNWAFQDPIYWLMSEYHKWVLHADPLWQGHLTNWPGNHANYDINLAEWQLSRYAQRLPNTVIACFNNNVNALGVENTYQNFLPVNGFLGKGLSCQGWMFPNAGGVPIGPQEEEVFCRWCDSAVNTVKVKVLQIEPSWAFIDINPGSTTLGAALPLLKKLQSRLGC